MIDETRYRETTQTEVARPRMATEPEVDITAIDVHPDVTTRTAWGAIWAGVMVAIGSQALLTLLGAAIGLSAIGAGESVDTAKGVGIGAAIWWTLSGIIALFLGGWTVGYLLGPRRPFIGALHGFVMWCTVTALSAFFIATLGGAVLGGGLNMLGTAVRSQQSQSPDNSRNVVDEVRQNQRDPQVRESADEATEATAGATWWTFIALVLGATAAVIGGTMTPDREERFYRRRAID